MFPTFEEDHVREAKELEKQGVVLAESGRLTEALEVFNNAVLVSPLLASVYNNRAQTFRLLNRNEGNVKHKNKLESSIILKYSLFSPLNLQKLWMI